MQSRPTLAALFFFNVFAAGCASEVGPVEVVPPTDAAFELSAARAPGEAAADRVAAYGPALAAGKADGASIVYETRVPLATVDLSAVPVWTRADLDAAFAFVRDTRFMVGVEPADFARRITFLFPDDGCFARSRAMDWVFTQLGYAHPMSVFTFGNLRVPTAHHPAGAVEWWFHVAPIVAVDGVAYVIDPAIEPSAPLPLADWVARQGDASAIEVAVCSGSAHAPAADCYAQALPESSGAALGDEYWYLYSEWDRQVDLGRDPYQVLGDAPPWAVP